MLNLDYYMTEAPIQFDDPDLAHECADLNKQKAARKASGIEYRRLASILRPDTPSVVHYEEHSDHAKIDVSGAKIVANRTIGGDPSEAQRRADDIARVADGKPLEQRLDIQGLMNHEARTSAAIEVVIERTERKIKERRQKLGLEYLAKIKSKTDEQTRRFKKALADLKAAHGEITALRNDLRDSGIGFPVGWPAPDFVTSAGDLLEEGKRLGYVS
jgi:hypothetical protein